MRKREKESYNRIIYNQAYAWPRVKVQILYEHRVDVMQQHRGQMFSNLDETAVTALCNYLLWTTRSDAFQ